MEINPRLTLIRSLIGQSMTQTPSGVGRWLGGILQEADEGRLVASYTVRPDMTNPMQVLHGGAASAILDDLCGLTVLTLNRDHAFTSVNLTMDFLNAARLGDTLTAEVTVVRAGRNIIHLEGRITSAEGKLIARCNTNLIQTSVRL